MELVLNTTNPSISYTIIGILRRRFPGCEILGNNDKVHVRFSFLVRVNIAISRRQNTTVLDFSNGCDDYFVVVACTGVLLGVLLLAILSGNYVEKVYSAVEKDMGKLLAAQSNAAFMQESSIQAASGSIYGIQLEPHTVEVNEPPTKMFRSPLTLSGRISRTEYIISLAIFAAYAYLLILSRELIGNVFFTLAWIPAIWFLYAQASKRCHDRELPEWKQLIPFYHLWLTFLKGDESYNKYGFPPKGFNGLAENYIIKEYDSHEQTNKKRKKSFIALAVVCGVLLLIGTITNAVNKYYEELKQIEIQEKKQKKKEAVLTKFNKFISEYDKFMLGKSIEKIRQADKALWYAEQMIENEDYAEYIDDKDMPARRRLVDSLTNVYVNERIDDNGFFASPGNFSVKFPGKATSIHHTVDGSVHHWSQNFRGIDYTVTYYKSYSKLKLEDEINTANRYFGGKQYTDVAEKYYVLDGQNTKIFSVKEVAPNITIHYCVSVRDNNYYFIIVEDSKGNEKMPQEVRDFFDSFVIKR